MVKVLLFQIVYKFVDKDMKEKSLSVSPEEVGLLSTTGPNSRLEQVYCSVRLHCMLTGAKLFFLFYYDSTKILAGQQCNFLNEALKCHMYLLLQLCLKRLMKQTCRFG